MQLTARRSESWPTTGDLFDVVLIGAADGAMAEAVALAGGRVVGRSAIDAPIAAGADTIVAVDLTNCGDAALDWLPDLATRADIVACGLAQLDAVAAALLLSDAQLLCDPTPAERIEAFVLAAVHANAPEAMVREGEAERLARLRGEVGRIALVLARLAGDAEPGDVADLRPTFHPEPAARDARADAVAVRRAIRARRLRATYFGDGVFEDPAWDMILDLHAAELEGGRVSVSSLCIAANVAPTTALRWIGRLADAGLFERRADPHDRRRAFIALSARGSAAMRGYLAGLERAGLTLG